MNFESWMRAKGLSDKSIKNYSGALAGSLSHWAYEAQITDRNLLGIKLKAEFDPIATALSTLPIFIDRNARGKHMYSNALNRYSEYLAADQYPVIYDDIVVLTNDAVIDETTRQQLVNARIGQGKFRRDLLAYWRRCSVTGYAAAPSMLVASHIKPWSQSNNTERLDPFNGLLLLPSIDRAFDQGLISFDSTGKIIISKRLINPKFFGIHPEQRIELTAKHHAYMLFHRDKCFRSD